MAVQRIVSLKPNITMILQDLRLGDQIVGITKYCPQPNETAQIIGDYNNVDVEAIARLKPTIILTSMENSQSKQFEALQSMALNVVLIDFKTYDAMLGSLKKLGELFGQEDAVQQKITALNTILDGLQKSWASQVPPSFLVLVQRRPLMVASGQTYISTLLAHAGLRNVFGGNHIAFPVIDEEEFIRETVDFAFELSHDANGSADFLNKSMIRLNISDFLATPQSVANLQNVLNALQNNPAQ